MSSILDALNKLEQEKSSRQAETADTIVPATPEEATAELLGEASFDNSRPRAVKAWAPVLAALILGAAITAVTVVITVWLVAKPGETVAAMPAPPAAETEVPLVHKYTIPVQVETAAVQEENTPPPAAEEPALAVVAAVPAPPRVEESKPVPEPEPEPEPEPVPEVTVVVETPPVAVPEPAAPPTPAPEPAPEVTVAAETLPAVAPEPPAPAPVIEAVPPADEHPLPDTATLMRQQELARAESAPPENGALEVAKAAPSQRPWTTTPSPTEPPSARTDSGPVDMNALPRLSSQDRESLGLDNIRLNVLRPADKDQPDALAIINLKKVYVGEMIPGTRARLIGVEANAIGVEVNSDGGLKRYRIPR